jgi:hypothetical protein
MSLRRDDPPPVSLWRYYGQNGAQALIDINPAAEVRVVRSAGRAPGDAAAALRKAALP